MDSDEAERQRIADDDQSADDTRLEAVPDPGERCLVVQTKTVGTYPTAAGSFFAVATAQAFGAEVEGGAGSVTAGSDTFHALNVGTAVPPSGTNVIATFVDYRWVFRYDG